MKIGEMGRMSRIARSRKGDSIGNLFTSVPSLLFIFSIIALFLVVTFVIVKIHSSEKVNVGTSASSENLLIREVHYACRGSVVDTLNHVAQNISIDFENYSLFDFILSEGNLNSNLFKFTTESSIFDTSPKNIREAIQESFSSEKQDVYCSLLNGGSGKLLMSRDGTVKSDNGIFVSTDINPIYTSGGDISLIDYSLFSFMTSTKESDSSLFRFTPMDPNSNIFKITPLDIGFILLRFTPINSRFDILRIALWNMIQNGFNSGEYKTPCSFLAVGNKELTILADGTVKSGSGIFTSADVNAIYYPRDKSASNAPSLQDFAKVLDFNRIIKYSFDYIDSKGNSQTLYVASYYGECLQ